MESFHNFGGWKSEIKLLARPRSFRNLYGHQGRALGDRLLLNHEKTLGFLASREEFNLGPEMRLSRSELLCNKVLLKYKRDRESF